MKIYLLHGEYNAKSYEKLNEYIFKAKEKNWKIVKISEKTGYSIQESLSSSDFFDIKKVFVLDGVTKLVKKEIDWINKNFEYLAGILILYSNTKLNSTLINKFKKIDKIEEFSLPQNIFSFLDAFYPGNSVNCLGLLHNITEKEKIEFIYFFLSKHIRDLYWVKTSPSNIPYPSWRVDKLEKQANKFTLEQLKKTINSLSDIDIQSKTSNLDLNDLLDLLIIRQLE